MTDILLVQQALSALGFPPGPLDGVLGKKTLAAVDLALDQTPGAGGWTDARRFVAVEQLLYKARGIEVGTIDGLVGPQTEYAREVYAARLRGDKTVETWRDNEAGAPAGTGNAKAWWPRQSDVQAFYGKPGSSLVSLTLPYPMRLAWDRSTEVKSFQCHAKVVDAFGRIFRLTLASYGQSAITNLRLDLFGGCFNIRKMRGGSALSMHSWGIAVDIDPERNQLKWGRDKATLDGPEYDAWWKIVEAEGMISLGRARNYDWMHFQAARL